MSFEVDVTVSEMGALAESGIGGSEQQVTSAFQERSHFLPCPAPCPCAVRYQERCQDCFAPINRQPRTTSNNRLERPTTTAFAHRRARNPLRARCAHDDSRSAPTCC